MTDERLRRLFAVTVLLACPFVAAADDGLEAARRLYAAAAYEEALRALEGSPPPVTDTGAVVAIEQQRLLCLVALGRPADAEQAITAIVQADPLYVPDQASAPPRVRTAFLDVRARLVPAIAKSDYERARDAYELGDFGSASAGFTRVLAIVDASGGTAADPLLRDIAVLATGFKTLSDKAAAAPPPPAAPASAPLEPPAPAAAAPAPPIVPVAARIYDATYPGIVAPAIVHQDVPQWPRALGPMPNRTAVIEVVITEEGLVESAKLTQHVHPSYDQRLLAATSKWSYVPAQVKGERVRFKKVLRLNFQ
jgi:TonB family protein